MPVEQIVIEVVSNSKQLDSLLDKLVKAGQLSKQQADQFRADSQKFEDAAKKRAKLLDEEIKDLTELRLRKQQAFSTREIEDYNRRIKESESRIKSLGGEVRKQKETFTAFDRTVRNIGATLAAAFTVERLVQFGIESVKLAAKAQGIERAFAKLNDPSLLKNLRTATRGTVTDLELMRGAVRAENFKIPLEQLATFFKFATERSIETGDSVDYLVNSIVNGIGRKSALVLDNLGISVAATQAEFRKTGDFGQAAANLIQREMEKVGEVIDSDAVKLQRLQTRYENFKKGFGGVLIALTNTPGEGVLNNINKAVEGLNKLSENASSSQKKRIEGVLSDYRRLLSEIDKGGLPNLVPISDEERGRILIRNNEIKELLSLYKELAADQRAISNLENLTERFNSANQAIGRNITSADKAALSFGVQSDAVKQLLEDYDKYLLLLEDGKSVIEAFIEVNKKEFNEFDRKVKALNQEEAAREALNDQIRTSIELLRQQAVASITSAIETARTNEELTNDIFEDALERDRKEAESFDQAEEGKRKRKDQAAKEDKDRMTDLLESEYEIAQARVALASNLFGVITALGKDNAEAQAGLLAFEKLAAIASIIINLQKEIALNSATLLPGIRDAANIQSRLRAASGIATVLATAIPQFAEGVIDLKGGGTSKSDSILARLSKGESVMTADETSKYRREFIAMRENKWKDFVFRNYQLPMIKSVVQNNSDFNDRNIVDSLSRIRKGQDRLISVVSKKPQHQLAQR